MLYWPMHIVVGLLKIAIRTDVLLWIIGGILILIAVVMLILQFREHNKLKKNLSILQSLNKRNIELDMVLKAMKLATWKVDVTTRNVTFDSDYREANNLAVPPDSSVYNIFSHLLPEYSQKAMAGMEALLEGSIDEFHLEYRMKSEDSEQLYWGESYAMIGRRSPTGEPLEIIGTSRRIDQQKKNEDELREARNKAEESDRLKSAFLANISHEIRTPLNAIVGFSDILPLVDDKEERANIISLIQENNRKLLHMIDDIVNISKLEAGVESVQKEDFDLNQLLQEKVSKHQAENTKPDVDISLSTKDESLIIHTDRYRLSEILEQYLLNAVKFTDNGSVVVGYDLMPGDAVRIWVQDSGKGIPADQCDKIFEHFVKLDNFVPGTGLGLPICRSTAQSIGAKVGVESQEGVGSNFWVELRVRD